MKKKNNNFFSSSKWLWLLIASLFISCIVFAIVFLKFDVIELPSNSPSQVQIPNSPAANISAEEAKDVFEAIPREEFANALAKMQIPNEFYRSYRIVLKSGEYSNPTEYYAIKKNNDWWVQISKNGVIRETTICHNGIVTIADNAANTFVNTENVSFEERCNILSLQTLVNMINDIANDRPVNYGGGISDYSLSYTQTKTSGENLFSFAFVCKNGISEEYTFSFENSVILSASKKLGDEEIYKMEIRDYRNSLSGIDTDSLFSVE